MIKRNYAFPGAATAWKCDNATPVFFFGHTGPGTRPGHLLGPGGLAYGPEDNSDMERVDGSGPASPPPANLSGSILIFLDLEPAAAASGPDWQARLGNAALAGAHRVLVTLGACTFRSSARFGHRHHFMYYTHFIRTIYLILSRTCLCTR